MHISIDMGGTTTRIASSKNLVDTHKIEEFPTDSNLSNQKNKIKKTIQKIIDNQQVEFICIGVPGIVDKKNRMYKNIVNYPKLSGKSFEFIFDLPEKSKNLFVENDAALAGLGEANRGEASQFKNIAYLTLSTGVGGVQILDKKINNYQNHSEPGHMIIVEGGIHDDVCGQDGCLHAYLSGDMFEKTYYCDGKKVCKGERPEDTKDKEIWGKYGKHLATGIINIIAMWNPELIIVGGSITNKWDLFIQTTLEQLSSQDLFDVPKIIRSELNGRNGILGGFDLIKQKTTQ